MSDLISNLLGNLGGDTTDKIGSKLGIDPKIISAAIPILLPMIMGGLKNQSANNGGQERVDHILNKYGDPNILDNVDGHLEQSLKQENFDSNLGGLLGNSGSQVTDMLTKNFNLDASSAAKIIPMVAPLIMGYLAKNKNEHPEGSTGFASFLDSNGDGSVLDDVVGLFSGKDQNTPGAGGGLMDMLGGLLGGKK